MKNNSKQTLGFTLLELVIVLGLIGILSTISYPLYTAHVIKIRRAYATTVLMDAAGCMEKYYAEHNTYSGATKEKLFINQAHHNNYYRLEVKSAGDVYTLQMTPVGKQAEDLLCGSLILDHNGNKSTSGDGDVAQCWH